MNQDEFWSLIDRTRDESSGDPYQQADLLVEELTKLPEQDIIDYGMIYREFRDRAYLADLWDAAAIIDLWGCTDDGFIDFRAWLIAQGRTIYYEVLANPEALVDIVSPGMETQIEPLSYVAGLAYRKKTASDLEFPLDHYTPPKLKGELALDPLSAKGKFPRLMAKFKDNA